MEELPDRSVDDLIGRVAEDVNNRVGGVEDVSIIGKVCDSELPNHGPV